MEFDERPWGNYLVLADELTHKVKRITVYPKKRLSLQRHQHRQEHWYLLAGKAEVTLNERKIILEAHQSVDIPRQAIHRISNIGDNNVEFIEIQTGDSFDESDIERLEDDFGRLAKN